LYIFRQAILMSQTKMHIWQYCHHCGTRPIVGKRYHCISCPEGPDNDLCQRCFIKYQEDKSIHNSSGFGRLADQLHQFMDYDGRSSDLYSSWLSVATADPQHLFVDPGFILRPEFVTSRGSYFGG